MKKTIILGLFALAMVLSPVFTSAQLTPAQIAEIQAQIAALRAQADALNAQLGANNNVANTPCPLYTRDLTVGSSGNDVGMLQGFLRAKGHFYGDITNYFGDSTVNALIAYQLSKGIQPANGYFGPLTRATVNAECGGDQMGGIIATPPVIAEAWGITVTSPNGGEKWSTKGEYEITWSSHGVGSSKRVDVYLHHPDGRVCHLGNSTVGAKSFKFTMEQEECWGDRVQPGSYKISIYVEPDNINVADFSYKDSSDNYFTITPRGSRTPTITVTYPNGGEVLNNGGKDTIATIRWNRSNFRGKTVVDIGLANENGSTGSYENIANNIPNNGKYVWKSDPSIASGNYRIVVSTNERDVQDKSDNYFTFQTTTGGSSEPYFIFPKSNSTLLRGAWYTLQWNAPASYTSNTEVYLASGAGHIQSKIATVSSPQSSYQWTVPANAVVGSYYRIVLVRDGQTLGTSDYFSIAASAGESVTDKKVTLEMPTTNFTKPNNESFQVSYSWKANYTVERSWFQLINSAGEIKNAGGAGSYTQGSSATSRTMTFPAYLSTGTYTFKVCDVTTSAVSSTSVCDSKQIQVNQAPVVKPVTFTFPTASSKLIRGAWHQLRWENVPSSVYDVDLYFVQNGTETKITTVSYGQSAYQWTVPASTPVGTSNKIKIVNKATGQTLATSESFEITQSAGETVTNKSVSLSLSSNTISKTDNTTDLQIPYTWSANYSVERSWFQLINSAGEMKNAGGAGAFTLGAGPTSRNLNFPAYLSTGTYTLKLCDVTTSSVSPTSICDTETLTVTSNVSNQEVSSQTASILESLKNLFNQWR